MKGATAVLSKKKINIPRITNTSIMGINQYFFSFHAN
jgi:hypothetical protein